MSGIGDQRSGGERRELYELLSAMDAEAKDVVKIKEEKRKEVLHSEKKKDTIGYTLADCVTKRVVEEEESW